MRIISLVILGSVVALLGAVRSNVASPLVGDESNSAPPTRSDPTRTGANGDPLFTLEFGTVSFGGSAPDDGTIMVVGRNTFGTISNENHTIEVGPVPILIAASTGNGDANHDGNVDVFDFEGFLACFSGPDAPYVDPSCWVFDMNRDGSVDWTDYALFQLAVTGG